MTDVLVLGGGPAGCATALRLAARGRRVTLVSPPPTAGREGLSARTVALLRGEGFESVIGELRGPAPRVGEWGLGRAVTGEEWLADRERLACAMRRVLADAGVRLLEDVVTHVTGRIGALEVHARALGMLVAACVVDARGRGGPELHGPVLLAVGRAYRTPSRRAPGTVIHALRSGWCWIVTEGVEAWVQVAGRPGDGRPDEWHVRAAAECGPLAAILDGAEPLGATVARPAHARRAASVAEAGVIRIGDAAVGLDPLSGQGVYEALRAAPIAVAAVSSLLAGEDPGLVYRFLSERDDALWARILGTAAAFYEENAALGSFWAETASQYRALTSQPSAARSPAIERRPVLDGDRIRECEVLVTSEQPRGVWQVEGVPVVDLIHYIERAATASPRDAAAALARPPAAILAAAHWLRAAGAWPARVDPSFAAGG